MGRKNYYGSGALWSGRLAAMLFSLFATLSLAKINIRTWLTWFLQSCAENGGQAPCGHQSVLALEDVRKRNAASMALDPDDSS